MGEVKQQEIMREHEERTNVLRQGTNKDREIRIANRSGDMIIELEWLLDQEGVDHNFELDMIDCLRTLTEIRERLL
jgi:hypothetical protein